MKKITFNEWTFTLSILGFLSLCFLSTNVGYVSLMDIIITIFAGLILFSLVITMLITKGIPKLLKFIVYGFFILMVIVSMSSCGTTKYGCPYTRGMTGYR
jgi:hypothetical protein